jgi:hypothetical protein
MTLEVKINPRAYRKFFFARLKALRLITDSLNKTPSESLAKGIEDSADQIQKSCVEYEDRDVAEVYETFGSLVVVYSRLLLWKAAIREAQADAVRFKQSADMLISELVSKVSLGTREFYDVLISAASKIISVDDVRSFGSAFGMLSLEVSFDAPGSRAAREAEIRQHRIALGGPAEPLGTVTEEDQQPIIAFVKFEIDGFSASNLNFLEPRIAHDLTLELRVSNWPKNGNQLKLVPISVEDLLDHGLPSFIFSKPKGGGPHVLSQTKRATINTAHSIRSRPYEFRYAAEFLPENVVSRVEIVGHRTLRIEGIDSNLNPINGFRNIIRKLIEVRDRLRGYPGLPGSDIESFMKVLTALGNYAAQKIKRGDLPAGMLEREFQTKIAEFLRLDPMIGEDLEEHPRSAGGITDLVFKGVVIELKAEPKTAVTLESCKAHFGQTAAYASGNGKRVAVLVVLDSSVKKQPVGAAEDDIELITYPTGNSAIALGTIIVRGGLAKPSSLK